MASANIVVLMGNLTRDVEVRYLSSGIAVGNIGLAVSEKYKTKTGELREEVCFVSVEVWGAQAENCAKYLSKGRPVLVEGSLKFDSWLDKTTGAKRSKHSIKGRRVTFLGSRQDATPQGPPESPQSGSPYQEETSAGDDLPPF